MIFKEFWSYLMLNVCTKQIVLKRYWKEMQVKLFPYLALSFKRKQYHEWKAGYWGVLGEFSGALTVRSESLKGSSASESGDSGTTFVLFSTTGMVSLVTVQLGVACLFFLFFFASVLGGVTVAAEEGPAAVALWSGPPPFEALTNFPPCAGRVAVEVGV